MSRILHAGMFSQRVRFEEQQRTDDGLGGSVIAWEIVAERWAYVETLNGTSGAASDSHVAVVYKRVILRHDDTLHAGMRCVISGVIHRVEWVGLYKDNRAFTECRVSVGDRLS